MIPVASGTADGLEWRVEIGVWGEDQHAGRVMIVSRNHTEVISPLGSFLSATADIGAVNVYDDPPFFVAAVEAAAESAVVHYRDGSSETVGTHTIQIDTAQVNLVMGPLKSVRARLVVGKTSRDLVCGRERVLQPTAHGNGGTAIFDL